MQTSLVDLSVESDASHLPEKIEFLMNLVLFALDESSELGLDDVARLLDQTSLAVAAHRLSFAPMPMRQCA
jgi:hypothetical protein